jgi:N-glycosylase/DNA lyase
MPQSQVSFPVRNYDLAATLTSGQAFRWKQIGGAWEGVIGAKWVRLESKANTLTAQTAQPVSDWEWLSHYLQIDVDIDAIVRAFPDDEPMRASVNACRGLRLLRQDPWECLASFILSSTKQIVQIQQIVALLCERLGEHVAIPQGHESINAFPTAKRLAACAESELRDCKMGFRAPNLLETAKMLAHGEVALANLGGLSAAEARAELLKFPGVGPKIANCVLLFAYGFQEAFPVDVWVLKAIRQLYFPKRHPKPSTLRHFTATHFGPYAGYAQQYLFHYARNNL